MHTWRAPREEAPGAGGSADRARLLSGAFERAVGAVFPAHAAPPRPNERQGRGSLPQTLRSSHNTACWTCSWTPFFHRIESGLPTILWELETGRQPLAEG